MGIEEVKEIARIVGGKIEEIEGPLPDGSGFAVMSMELPKDHWIYQTEMRFKDGSGYCGEPPMPFRMGLNDHCIFAIQRPGQKQPNIMSRAEITDVIRKVGKYAVKASTMCGKDMDFDPDAMLQNLVTGFLGYWTEDGFSHVDDPKEA